MAKAMAAMSGGVDSSVTAWLLQQQGYDVMGATMRLYENEDVEEAGRTCCSLNDVEDARSVAARLGIPYYVFNFTEEFHAQVMDRFARAYAAGLTPNPCIDCNRYLKFGKLMDRAKELGVDYVATGHYARREWDEGSGRWLLKKGADGAKDQSYFLYHLTQRTLAHFLMPVGGLTKGQVREIAAQQGFLNARKRDSQDICFVPGGDYAEFIQRYTGKTWPEGDFVAKDGAVLGRHKGIIRYTLGQRRGLDVALGKRAYVCGKDMEKNRVILGENRDLYVKTVEGTDLNLIACDRLDGPIRAGAKIRYSPREVMATVEQIGEDRVRLVFDEPQRAAAPGQAVVFYDGDTVIGGAAIEKAY